MRGLFGIPLGLPSYGSRTIEPTADTLSSQKFAEDTVNGFYARVVIPNGEPTAYTSMYVPLVSNDESFAIWTEHASEVETILKIFKSVTFEKSDTSNNPPLTTSKFAVGAPQDQRVLIAYNCGSCHSLHRKLLGPPLSELVPKRSNYWIYTFLTDRRNVSKDSSYRALRSRYDFHCEEFPDMSRLDVYVIADYIKAQR